MSTPHEWVWLQFVGYQELRAKECLVTLENYPGYCDRGTVYAKVFCHGYPINDSPIDAADGWPRYYSSEEVAKSEVEWWMERRHYTPTA